MKNERISLFARLFSRKEDPAANRSSSVIITAYSQPHVLQQKMREEHLSHGETVRANISPVRLEHDHGKMILYFCPMKNIEVLETLSPGDGGSIPAQAKIEGFAIPEKFKSGFYHLKNVTLTSNGTIQVIATENTKWEYA